MMFHPPMLYSGYVGFSIPFAFAIGALITRRHRRRLDPRDAPLRADRLDLPRHRHHARRALVLHRARLGRLLGLGPGRERVADAVARRHRVPALDDGAGEARDAEDLERVADRATFTLALLGTFLVRSGSSTRSTRSARRRSACQFLVFIGVVIVGSAALIVAPAATCARRRGSTRCSRARRSSCSTTWCWSALCLVIVWGTFFPLISEAITGTRRASGRRCSTADRAARARARAADRHRADARVAARSRRRRCGARSRSRSAVAAPPCSRCSRSRRRPRAHVADHVHLRRVRAGRRGAGVLARHPARRR